MDSGDFPVSCPSLVSLVIFSLYEMLKTFRATFCNIPTNKITMLNHLNDTLTCNQANGKLNGNGRANVSSVC